MVVMHEVRPNRSNFEVEAQETNIRWWCPRLLLDVKKHPVVCIEGNVDMQDRPDGFVAQRLSELSYVGGLERRDSDVSHDVICMTIAPIEPLTTNFAMSRFIACEEAFAHMSGEELTGATE